jgi:antitoxin YefM
MQALNYSYVRQNLAGVMDECCENHEPLIVTRKNKEAQVVVMSKEDYDSWMETFHILQSHDLARLTESITQANAGQTQERKLLDD